MSAKNGWNVKLRIGQGLQGLWRSLTFPELVSLALDIYRRFRSVDQSKKMSLSMFEYRWLVHCNNALLAACQGDSVTSFACTISQF